MDIDFWKGILGLFLVVAIFFIIVYSLIQSAKEPKHLSD